MSSVTLTAATRQNLLSLQDTASLTATTQNRLSTGLKVSSALDNPVSFFTSQSLSQRSGDLGRALRSVYDDTLRESVPDDFLNLLGKLR